MLYSFWGVGSGVNEGPTILQHGGRTFLTFSASHCDTPVYKLGLMELTGSDPLAAGAWKKSANPGFRRNDATGVYGPGHNFFFPLPDGKEVWMAYHANSKAADGCGGTRTTRAQKVNWNADGTPNFGAPVSTSTALAEPSGTPAATVRCPPPVRGERENRRPRHWPAVFCCPGDRVYAAAFGCHAWNDAIRKNFQMWENLSGVSCVTSIDRICRPYGSPLPYASR